jgi:hypothetical protein
MSSGFASVEIALALDEDYSPSFTDGKLRISVEDDTVCLHVDKKTKGDAYILAEAPLADFQRAMRMLGIVEPTPEPAND